MSAVNMDILSRPFPKEAIKRRKGANGLCLNYVETHTVIRRLIEATGNKFDFHVLKIEQTPDLVIANVELELPGLGKREHCGTARVIGGNNEDTVKCAISDAIKKVFSLFSPAMLSLYGPDYEAAQPMKSAQPVQARNQRPAASGNGERPEAATAQSAFRPL